MIGDRADLAPLQGRAWDAAIDTSGYDPAQVAASAALDVGHYVFVSTCNAYPDWPDKPVDEDSPTWQDGEGYGPDKAAAERARPAGRRRRARGPDRRPARQRLPAAVVGAADRRGRRGARARARPDRPLQVIDARDLAELLLASPSSARAAPSTAPRRSARRRWANCCRAPSRHGSDAELRWIPEDELEEAGVEPWMELPLWLPARHLGTWDVGTDKAQAAGLQHATGRRDRRRHLEHGCKRRRGRARRLALRAPPAEDERRARGSAIPTSVLGIRAPNVRVP